MGEKLNCFSTQTINQEMRVFSEEERLRARLRLLDDRQIREFFEETWCQEGEYAELVEEEFNRRGLRL